MSKRAALVLALIAVAAVTVATMPSAVRSRLRPRPQAAAAPYSLAWYAQTAQAEGRTTYNISVGINEYPAPPWDTAVANSSVALAQLIDARSYPISDNIYVEGGIVTWYKFRILESWRQGGACSGCSDAVQPPAELLPLNADEILVSRAGGSLYVDGVTLNSVEVEFPQVPVGTRCILLYQKDPAQQASSLSPFGIYPLVGEDVFATVSALDPEGEENNSNPYTVELQRRYANSVSLFRSAVTGGL